MQSSICGLPDLGQQLGGRGIDYSYASHVYPYYPETASEMLYSLMSAEAYAVFEQIGDLAWDAWFALSQKRPLAPEKCRELGILPEQMQIIEEARRRGIKLNYALYQKIKDNVGRMQAAQAVFERTRQIADRLGLQLSLPPLFASLQERSCPYITEQAAVIRSDGAVVPCFKNPYSHNGHFNGRTRSYEPHIFGSILESPFADIWNGDAYRLFRSDMQDMPQNIAWCGDCSFSMHYCYFSEEARHDCMLNEPFCADCPFSLGLTRCLL